MKGKGNSLEFRYRGYDSRLGRFSSVDPLAAKYPWNSTYAFAENRVIDGIDLEGREYIHYSLKHVDGKPVIQKLNTENVHWTVFGQQKYPQAFVFHYNGNTTKFFLDKDQASNGLGGDYAYSPELIQQYYQNPENFQSEERFATRMALSMAAGLAADVSGRITGNINLYSRRSWATKLPPLSEARSLLNTALRRQGLRSAPNNFKERWSEGGYDYEVRIHQAQSDAPANSNSASSTTFRVARRAQGVDENGQGQGWEYADDKGNWHSNRDLKSGQAGAAAANDTHIPLRK